MEKIKVAVIGAGFMGPIHIEALRRLGCVEIVAIADADFDKAKEKAEYWCIPKVYKDFRELLEKEDFDVLHNCTPNNLHYEINAEVIKAGKHIFSEKPLAMNSGESKKLVELARQKKVVNAVGFNYRFNPLIQEVYQRIKKGSLGKIYLAHGSYLQDWLLFDTDYNWRIEPEVSGKSRAIADIGSHWCDMIQFLTGLKITRVTSNLKTVIPVRKKPKKAVDAFDVKSFAPEDYEEKKIDTEDCGSVLFEFENGVSGMFLVSQVSAGRKCFFNFEIDGSEGALWWCQENPEVAWIGHRGKSNELLIKDVSLMSDESKIYVHSPAGHPEGYLDGVKNLCLCVYNHIRNIKAGKASVSDKVNYPTFVDGHNALLVCEAILKSNEEKKWTEIKYP